MNSGVSNRHWRRRRRGPLALSKPVLLLLPAAEVASFWFGPLVFCS